MHNTGLKGVEFLLLPLMTLLAVMFIAFYAYDAWMMIAFPFPLDWSEGNIFTEVQRVLDGLPLYSRPADDYVANLYTPLYFYVSALLDLFTREIFIASRLISVLAVAGIGILTYKCMRRENGNRMLAFSAAGMFVATFKICDYWFVIARPDCLFLLLLLSGFYVALYHTTPKSAALAGLLFTAAFFTKQTVLIAIVLLLAAGVLTDWKRWRIIGIWFACASFIIGLILTVSSDGWFIFYAFKMPLYHKTIFENLLNFWTKDLFLNLWPCGVLIAAAVILDRKQGWKNGRYFLALCAGCVLVAYISRLHDGGWYNVLIPAFYAIILVSFLLLSRMRERMKSGLYVLALLFLIGQYVVLLYDPREILPTHKEVQTTRVFTDYLRDIDGDALIPNFPFLQTFAGKKSYGWGTAGWDIMRMPRINKVRSDFLQDLNASLSEGKYAVLFLGDRDTNFLHLGNRYCFKEKIISGTRYAPGWHTPVVFDVYVRCDKHS